MSLRCFVFALLIVGATCNIFDLVDDILEKIKDIFQTDEKPKSSNKLGLGAFVRQFLAGENPNLEQVVNWQIQLEEIAQEAGLYCISEEKDKEILRKLRGDPLVQNITRECNKFMTQPNCSDSLYRNIDGTCNNLKRPLWGSANIANSRFLPAAYEGIRGLRKSVDGHDLPTPRNISLQLKNTNAPSEQVSAFFSFYGQIIVHDVTLAPSTSVNGIAIPCCPYEPGHENFTSSCENIYFASDDPFYGEFNFTCMPFGRTAPYAKCNFDKRTPMNKKTSFIDVSIIYGSDDKEASEMRTNVGYGKLNTQESPHGNILPPAHDENTLFCPINKTECCFLSGDERVNQHTMLTCLQTMLVIFHNKVAIFLHKLNPHWDGEKVYQEARRIVVSVQQYMVYSEYVPLLVGPDNMKKYDLYVDFDNGSLYNEELDPTILIEFSTASFRLHSMVPEAYTLYHPKKTMGTSYSVSAPIHKGQMASFVAGSCEIPSEKNDRFIKNDVKGFLYRPPGAAFGTDLPAANIQRGRDHGLPVYIDIVQKCTDGEIKINEFSDLKHTMTKENIELLQKIYSNVSDIDLWIGMIMERAIKGGVTGPTAACISSIQFHRLKFGDVFFFSHSNSRYPFTKEQREFIKSFSLSRFICDTTKSSNIRKHPLQLPNKNNPMILCGIFPETDLIAFKEDNIS